MKKLLSVVMIALCAAVVSGQKIMKLDGGLTSGCKPLEAKRKGMSSVGKYEFGPYRIVTGKAGWTRTKSHKKLFSLETTSESKKKSSFVFMVNDKDTILVNTSTNTSLSETDLGSMSWMNKSKENYVVQIEPSADTVSWQMILVSGMGQEVPGNFHASGILTDGTTNIMIKEVKEWNDGKVPVMKTICGYEFILDDQTIAAVQSSIDTFQKKFVWLPDSLDTKLKSVIAAASASLMVHSDEGLAAMN